MTDLRLPFPKRSLLGRLQFWRKPPRAYEWRMRWRVHGQAWKEERGVAGAEDHSIVVHIPEELLRPDEIVEYAFLDVKGVGRVWSIGPPAMVAATMEHFWGYEP